MSTQTAQTNNRKIVDTKKKKSIANQPITADHSIFKIPPPVMHPAVFKNIFFSLQEENKFYTALLNATKDLDPKFNYICAMPEGTWYVSTVKPVRNVGGWLYNTTQLKYIDKTHIIIKHQHQPLDFKFEFKFQEKIKKLRHKPAFTMYDKYWQNLVFRRDINRSLRARHEPTRKFLGMPEFADNKAFMAFDPRFKPHSYNKDGYALTPIRQTWFIKDGVSLVIGKIEDAKGWKYIAKNKDGKWYVFSVKPITYNGEWLSYTDDNTSCTAVMKSVQAREYDKKTLSMFADVKFDLYWRDSLYERVSNKFTSCNPNRQRPDTIKDVNMHIAEKITMNALEVKNTLKTTNVEVVMDVLKENEAIVSAPEYLTSAVHIRPEVQKIEFDGSNIIFTAGRNVACLDRDAIEGIFGLVGRGTFIREGENFVSMHTFPPIVPEYVIGGEEWKYIAMDNDFSWAMFKNEPVYNTMEGEWLAPRTNNSDDDFGASSVSIHNIKMPVDTCGAENSLHMFNAATSKWERRVTKY